MISGPGAEQVRPAKQARRHRAVLDALAGATTVVPARFGLLLDSVDDVRTVLREESDRWEAQLAHISGRLQFRIRALYDEELVLREVVAGDHRIASLREATRSLPPDAGQRERVRLGELVAAALQRLRADDRLVVLEAVTPEAVDWTEQERGEMEHVVDVTVLVEDSIRQRFEDALEDLAAQLHPRIRLQLTGPMAAYDFVGGDGWD